MAALTATLVARALLSVSLKRLTCTWPHCGVDWHSPGSLSSQLLMLSVTATCLPQAGSLEAPPGPSSVLGPNEIFVIEMLGGPLTVSVELSSSLLQASKTVSRS